MKTDRRGWTRKTLDLLASWVWLAAVGVTVLETVGCAGVSTTPTPISVSVTISPILATVAAGGTQQFSAAVQNTSNTQVTSQLRAFAVVNSPVGTTSRWGWKRETRVLLASWVGTAAVGVTVFDTVGCAAVFTITTAITVSVTISPTSATVAAGG